MRILLFVALVFCLVDMAPVLANHWWGGEFGYNVKVKHPSIHGGWGWHWVGPSSGWTTFYDTHKKNPKGWWGGWEKKEKKHKKQHWW